MAIAEIFLSAFLPVLFEKLASSSGDLWNFARRERIDTLLTNCRNMLVQIESVLADAEEKQMTDNQGAIKLWLEELEDLAYDLDDVLDEFATEALRQKVMEEQRGSTSKVRALVPTCCMSFKPRTIKSGFRLRSQIKDINARLQALFERRTGLGLRYDVPGPSARTSQRSPSSSFIHEPRLHGRDEDRKAIIKLLVCDQPSDEKVGVVPIVGMGGLGKTTLAQDVYRNEMVGNHFEKKAWVCVSEVFEIMSVTKAILESVTSEPCHFKELNQVQVQLNKALAGKKFLIVLDDVWNENHGEWISLKSPLNDGASGSKVLVTTRNADVASMMARIDKVHFLKVLSEDDCWAVFAQHAFGNRSMDAFPNLVSIGRKIVKKCGGLPLAARTLGGLLGSQVRDSEWEKVLNSKMWELSDKKSDILPALRLSYYHLPSHLKKCFGYCSVLPKDYEFEEKELVLWWMAEGLIQRPMGQEQMEDLGREYFHELLSRSFFQPSSHGEVPLFVMHDLINDLAQFVARRICFRMENLEKSEGDIITTKTRHSSYTRGEWDGIRKFEAFYKAKNLRTFLPLGLRDRQEYKPTSYLTSDVPLHLLPSLTRLRVLSLRRYLVCELSSSIEDLKHVRFLDLSCALIATLPDSISTLYNLQTLILKECKNLIKLPADTINLVNLRHLDLTGADSLQEMPPKIGKLTSLQTLSNFIVSQGDGSRISELGSLIHLRGTLRISRLENVAHAGDAMRAKLKDKQGLNVLSMTWSNTPNNSHNTSVELEVLSMLRPHNELQELSIIGYHGLTFPTWIGDSLFSNMVSLKLKNCERSSSLPPLGQLPKLAKLHIQGMNAIENVGPEFYGMRSSNPFPALQTLTFEDMLELKDWSPFEVNEGGQAFSCMLELSIKRCPKLLQKLPSNLPCLRKLDVEGCPMLAVAWIARPIELNEMRSMIHFDSLLSLSLENVSILDSFGNPEVGNEAAVMENARYRHLSSLTSLVIRNIQGLTCLPNWFFQGLMVLQKLSIVGCQELTSLWKNEVRIHHHLPALERLVIEDCPQLISLFEEEGQKQHEELPCFVLLEYLEIKWCNKLEKLPRGLHHLRSLQELIIDGCSCLISFPEKGLPAPLRTLTIYNCNALRFLPELTMLNSLEKLSVSRCSSLTFISCSRTGLPCNLKKLEIRKCAKLESVLLEEGTKIHCPSLESVEIWVCERLKSLPDVTHNNFDGGSLKNLTDFSLFYCENVESIPEGWFTATNLRRLVLNGCKKLKGLPHHASNNLTSLQTLIMYDCDVATALSYLESLTRRSCNAATELTPLQTLYITSCDDAAMELISYSSHFTNLTCLGLRQINMGCKKPPSQWGLHRLSSLRELYLGGYGGASFPLIEEEEDGMMLWLPPSLLKLSIWEFPNLEKLSCKGFQNIPSLEELRISDCPNLSTITKLGLPPSLLELSIRGCPKLKQRCEKKKGQYWPLISHIPNVEIDDRNVFDPRS